MGNNPVKNKIKTPDKTGPKAPRKYATLLVLPVALIAAVSFAVYFNALFNGFVWDDEYTVVQNTLLRDVRNLPAFFTQNVWSLKTDATGAASNYFRPIMNVIFMINYHVFGLQPWGFHLINILFHAAISILVYLIALELFKRGNNTYDNSSNGLQNQLLSIPFVAAVLFAVHPVHTEAVTWVTALTEISYGFFYLLSLLLYIYSSDSGSLFKRTYLLSLLSFFLAVLCKEPALILPAILIVYDHAIMRKPVFSLDSLKRYVPYLLTAGCYLVMRSYALGSLLPVQAHSDLSDSEVVINAFPLFAEYFRKLLIPANLNLLHVLDPIDSLVTVKGIVSFIVAVAFLLSLIYSFKKSKVSFFALMFWFVTIVPALYIRGIVELSIYVSERYLYLPSFGFVILLSLFLKWAQVNVIRSTAAFAGIFFLIAGSYAFATIERNAVWKDDYTLFSDTVKKSPSDEIANINLAGVLSDMGRLKEAIDHFQIASMANPDNVKIYVWLGDALFRNGQKNEAMFMYKFALELNPELLSARKGLGFVYYDMGFLEKAMDEYQAALRLKPDDADSLFQLNMLKSVQNSPTYSRQ